MTRINTEKLLELLNKKIKILEEMQNILNEIIAKYKKQNEFIKDELNGIVYIYSQMVSGEERDKMVYNAINKLLENIK